MDELHIIRKLSAASAGDGPPQIDVTGAVLARLRGRARSVEPVFWLSGALAAAAAVIVVAVALHVGGGDQQDPLVAMFSSATVFLE